jgi:hypothetical protein
MESVHMPTNEWTDKENVAWVHSGILLSHKEEWDPVICSKVAGVPGFILKETKPDTERQGLHALTQASMLKTVVLK